MSDVSIEQLRHQVWQANMDLERYHLVTFTWGNVSGIDRERGIMLIKPSGVPYSELSADNMVEVSLEDGKVAGGQMKPSSDTATHLELYQRFPEIQGIVHTHSTHAVAWAQAGMDIPAFGTTHADYFYGPIPCTRALKQQEIDNAYELNTGKVIAEHIDENQVMAIPGIVVKEHGPFAWGTSPANAVHNAVVLEEVARMALYTLQINAATTPVNQGLLDKHYLRKHGKNAYYGQSTNK
ncbi:L-ribulose-5-phosphate 4-epimerase [Celerinatantimonas sp. MCCC 1A17872]|uniref:L-ribulose-5-phosphate 4-epimerase n=1 Tax=Celerinatantimonas sp. MCCC 1A17872 TaxID=3177514 RepID=UPI0038C9CA77